ncbi:MAG: sterol desaturase family protein [Deltaproteobacteria bacterium]|nr:sterol desaturase family protein [Deltaproteobacteria bacterium]
MSEGEITVARTVGAGLALLFALSLQRARPHAAIRPTRRGNISLWALNLIVMGAVCGACACSVARWAAASGIGLLNASPAPLWLAVPTTILTLDFVSYLWHRANHRLAWLRRFHQVHHSDVAFSVSTAVRFHPGELLLALPVRLVAVAALGAPTVAIIAFEIIFTIANLVVHGNINLPRAIEQRLAAYVITPALHRRHHSRRGRELDHNFGTILSLWDRWLGTYVDSSSADRVDVGLRGLTASPRLLDALRLTLRRQSLRPTAAA